MVRVDGAPVARIASPTVPPMRSSILDFAAPADGIGDDYPAFCAARDSRPADSIVRIRMPARSYLLSQTPEEHQRTVVVLVDDGASFIGGHRPFGSRVVMGAGSQHTEYLRGRADDHEMIGNAVRVHNDGPRVGYGYRFEYISDAVSGGGGDIAQASICQWNKLDHGIGAFGMWNIYVTPPETPKARWRMVAAEFNVVNRGADHGWAPHRATHPTAAGIHTYGPMASSFAGPIGRNILFAQCFFEGPGTPPARTYNLQLGGTPARDRPGRLLCLSLQGSTEADRAKWPAAAVSLAHGWRDGFRADQAQIRSGAAYSLGPDQSVAYRDALGVIIARDMAGPGEPEGRVAAPPGSTWRHTDSAEGRRFYVKESRDDATGWVSAIAEASTGFSATAQARDACGRRRTRFAPLKPVCRAPASQPALPVSGDRACLVTLSPACRRFRHQSLGNHALPLHGSDCVRLLPPRLLAIRKPITHQRPSPRRFGPVRAPIGIAREFQVCGEERGGAVHRQAQKLVRLVLPADFPQRLRHSSDRPGQTTETSPTPRPRAERPLQSRL